MVVVTGSNPVWDTDLGRPAILRVNSQLNPEVLDPTRFRV